MLWFLIALFYPVAVFQYLLGSVDTVSGITKTGKDVAVLVQTFILSTDVNVYIRMGIG